MVYTSGAERVPRRNTTNNSPDQAMSIIELLASLALLLVALFFYLTKNSKSKASKSNPNLKSYPLIGSSVAIFANRNRGIQWTSDLIQNSPTATVVIRRFLDDSRVLTGNPANVQHMLKTQFYNYEKGSKFRRTLFDFLGNGIFNIDGDSWKFQRQVSSHEFNTKSLRKFVETVVDNEVSQRLIPILSTAAANNTVLDLQDILQRFAFDNICKIAFGYDPAYLLPDLPEAQFAKTFDEAARISSDRFATLFPFLWKIKRFFNIGSEKRLKEASSELREFARNIIKEKKQELSNKSSLETVDLLSRFLSSGHSDEDFVTDIVISFILAGRDTTSAALTWYFWLLSQNPEVEKEILREIKDKSESPVYEEVKDMVYTHASLCESMRLYPPVPVDGKVAMQDDVLPDGTVIKKGMRVSYHPYAMGRLEMLWGPDWEKFKPERWLQGAGDGVNTNGKWSFVGKDPYSYPVFQAGPRICLGKDMAFLQMKRVVAGIVRRFKVVPAAEEGFEPVFVSYLTSKMQGGFPVRQLSPEILETKFKQPRRNTTNNPPDQAMSIIELLASLALLLVSLFFYLTKNSKSKASSKSNPNLKSYPLIGSSAAMFANRNRGIQWTSDLILNSPSATFVLPLFLDDRHVLTGNPANVHHILKTQFYNYEKGSKFRRTLFDFLGNGIFNIDGDSWKFQRRVKRVFNIGSEKRLKEASSELREFARNIIKEKKQELSNKSSLETVDLLSRFLSSGHSDEDFVTDIVISFILAGRDTTSAALTWYFWLLSQNPEVEREILREIKDKSESPVYEEVKDMVYTHASLCESMRLYPPVPIDTKVAMHDDILPDGTVIKKGTAVSYHPYAMGRLEMLWGPDWEKFKPERWLQGAGDGVNNNGTWSFVGRDPYSYPVFQAGPRICLGKDMAFLQMKRVVAGILRSFKVVPAAKDGVEPVFVTYLTSKMQGGFPEPGMEHRNCMVYVLGHAGLLEEAKNLTENADCRDDPSLWTVLPLASSHSAIAELFAEMTHLLALPNARSTIL
ncbi:hypothetical protein NC651_014259 [Populus alba x Populus x berolinensis]|nr:hypothetical protein NC651_014259 [Populus alba x Populus x berolinensis]